MLPYNLFQHSLKTVLKLGVACLFIVVIQSCNKSKKIEFTTAEKEWLKQHTSITLAVDQTYPPLNYKNDQQEIVGLNIDLVKLIELRTGIKINLIGDNWDNALSMAMNHEVDGIINATSLKERETRLVFTKSITQDPQALVIRKIEESENKFQFKNKKIAAKKNSIQLDILRNKDPSIRIVEVNTLKEGITMLSMNEVDGVYDDLAPLYYFITSHNLNSLEIGLIEYNNQKSSIGLRNNDPILLSVFNKAISSISKEEKNAIKEKWLQFAPKENLIILYTILGVLFIVLVVALVWSWSLKALVAKRTKALNKELEERIKVESDLKSEQHFSNNILDSVPGIFFMYELFPEPKLIRWNRNHETVFHFSASELKHRSVFSFFDTEEHSKIADSIKHIQEQGETVIEAKILTKEGKGIPHLMMAKIFKLKGKEYFLGYGIDITERLALLEELQYKNEQLIKYSFDNAHKVRGPLARILGLLNLVHLNFNQNAEKCFPMIYEESIEMENIVRDIGKELYESTDD